MKFELPLLSYEFNALEPYIDAQTVEIHYTKHHTNYLNKLNDALSKHPELPETSLPDLLTNLKALPEDIQTTVKNNSGGVFNHNLYWETMIPDGSTLPPGLSEAVNNDFGSLENFKQNFSDQATALFGSGWTWLILDGKKLDIINTSNQDSPISEHKIPLLGLDVWEHAYYLKYQNRRQEYISAWWNLVNWPQVDKNRNRQLT